MRERRFFRARGDLRRLAKERRRVFYESHAKESALEQGEICCATFSASRNKTKNPRTKNPVQTGRRVSSWRVNKVMGAAVLLFAHTGKLLSGDIISRGWEHGRQEPAKAVLSRNIHLSARLPGALCGLLAALHVHRVSHATCLERSPLIRPAI